MRLILAIFLFCYLTISASDTIYTLPQIDITASVKQQKDTAYRAAATSTFLLNQLDNSTINNPKDLSLITPNLHMPDYGSKMTGSIYVRGLGSRMEHPSMGLYLDNIPILNKNNYDFDFFDIRRIDILRGPQSTLFGRNSIGGVMDIHTLSPMVYEGIRSSIGYANANTLNFRLSVYQHPHKNFAYSIAMTHNQSDGFYKNEYTNEYCDWYINNGGRLRLQWNLTEQWSIDNVLTMHQTKQGGFAYALLDENTNNLLPINYNDLCSYDRFSIINGTTIQYRNQKILFSSTTSFQHLNDKMVLDQDFTPESMFTLSQHQKENAVTQEFILKERRPSRKWQWLFGAFGFWKHTDMNAPVLFKEDGINELILANANQGIHTVFPEADLLIQEKEFPIESKFKLPAWGTSLFHQSAFYVGKWVFTAGLRLDYEQSSIKYRNSSDLHYRFSLTMPQYKLLSVTMHGNEKMQFFEVMPRFSALYNTGNGNIYATIARGYKAGGFNTQIFSDILQNKMMNDMMSEIGIYFDDTSSAYDVASAISYKPEYSMNYELGTRQDFLQNRLHIDIALFYIHCRNQQLTVFPPGKSTGRLMSNAGQTRSYGIETSVFYTFQNLNLSGTYGYTDARFVSYNNGSSDYKGNYVPYVPQNTIYLKGEYNFNLNSHYIDRIQLGIDWRGTGTIYWNEENSLCQPLYGQLGASVSLKKGGLSCTVWGKNLTNTKYNTFYFKSMGNSFVQHGKPIQIGITLNLSI